MNSIGIYSYYYNLQEKIKIKIDQVCRYKVLNYVDNMYFMLFTKKYIHIYFSVIYMYAYYIRTLFYMNIVDTYMTALCINVYMIILICT